MTLDTASAREALWETIGDSLARTGNEPAIDKAIDRYADAIREQTYGDARDTVRRLADTFTNPTDALPLLVFAEWCIDAIGREP